MTTCHLTRDGFKLCLYCMDICQSELTLTRRVMLISNSDCPVHSAWLYELPPIKTFSKAKFVKFNFCWEHQFSLDKKARPELWIEPMMIQINSIHILYLKLLLRNGFTQYNTVFGQNNDFLTRSRLSWRALRKSRSVKSV